MKEEKKFELDSIISLFKQRKNSSSIAKELNISKSNMAYYTLKLKKLGILKKIGYGCWEIIDKPKQVQTSIPTHSTSKVNSSRGHAFIWKVKNERDYDWKKKLEENKVRYKVQSNGKVLRILFNGKKIWFSKETIIIFEPLDFFGRNAYESKGLAVNELQQTMKKLYLKLDINTEFKFTTSREHYGLIKNELARQCNSKGEKIHIRSEDGTEWLWIDDSHSLSELETNKADTNVQVQYWYNDHKKHNFKITPTFLLENLNNIADKIKQVTNNQVVFDRNIVKHQQVLDEMSLTLKEIRDKLNNL